VNPRAPFRRRLRDRLWRDVGLQDYSEPMWGTGGQSEWVQHAPNNEMDDPGEIERFYDCCSV